MVREVRPRKNYHESLAEVVGALAQSSRGGTVAQAPSVSLAGSVADKFAPSASISPLSSGALGSGIEHLLTVWPTA